MPRFDNNRLMPRTARASVGGYCYHALNRGNARTPIFHKAGDYLAFERILAEGLEDYAVSILAFACALIARLAKVRPC